jgi:hypothetical protein
MWRRSSAWTSAATAALTAAARRDGPSTITPRTCAPSATSSALATRSPSRPAAWSRWRTRRATQTTSPIWFCSRPWPGSISSASPRASAESAATRQPSLRCRRRRRDRGRTPSRPCALLPVPRRGASHPPRPARPVLPAPAGVRGRSGRAIDAGASHAGRKPDEREPCSVRRARSRPVAGSGGKLGRTTLARTGPVSGT